MSYTIEHDHQFNRRPSMIIEYTIHGVTLNEKELAEVDEYYEAACTAQYLLNNYPSVADEDEAMSLGYEVRQLMYRYDMDESDAIDEVMEGRK